jgi:hypothetical protein
MLRDFVPLAVALTIAAAIYVARERRRRQALIQPLRPDLTMTEAWDLWRSRGEHASREVVQAQAGASLLDTERLLVRADNPLRLLRTQIVSSATTCLYLEAILEFGEAERKALLKGYNEGMEPVLRHVCEVATLRWTVLREYGNLKYDDAAPNDWFHHYLRVAGPYIREKVRLSREYLMTLDEGAGRLAEIYDALLDDLARGLIKSPRKKRFVPPA